MEITYEIGRQELQPFMKKLKYKNYPVRLVGTASLKSQLYFSDFDMISKIQNVNYKDFNKILYRTMHDENMYFIEMKIQSKNNKTKFYNTPSKEEFDKAYENAEYIKLDYVVRIKNDFYELSVIYFVNDDEIKDEQQIKELKDDIKEQLKEKNYYKMLKRVFSILKHKKERHLIIKLSKFFNSEIGAYYQLKSRLEAIRLLLDNYNDKDTINKIKIALKDLNQSTNVNKIDNTINELKTITNEEAHKFLKTNDIKIKDL